MGRKQRNYFRVHLLLTLSLILLLALGVSSEAKRTHYDELELEQAATLQDIKKAYRRLAVKHHPDRNIGREEEATVKFRAINEAYEILSDESSRRQYDQSLKYGDGRRSYFDSSSFENAGDGQQRREQRRHESSLSGYLLLLLDYLQRNGWTIVFMLTGSYYVYWNYLDPVVHRVRTDRSYRQATDPDRVAVLGPDMRRVRVGQQAAAAERALAAEEKRIARAKAERERKRVRMLSILAPRQVPRRG